MVVAMNADRVIGVDGDLPWKIREDLRHFRRVTMGHSILMGRKTWDSIGRPLPGRRNIVISRNRELKIEGAEVVHGLARAIGAAREGGDEEPRIIGGATLYEAALPITTRLFVTEVDRQVEGDTFFPEFDRSEWREISRRVGETEGVVFFELERIVG
jgi:dihydrofolate reductase